MKIAAQRIEAFLRRPEVAVVLVYGPDQGLVRERARALVLSVVDDVADPFRVSELSGAFVAADPAGLADEAAALALTGGRRVVRVEDAGDGASAALESLLAVPPCAALVVVEAGDLGKRSSLRRLFEAAEGAAAVPCYADDRASLEALIEGVLGRAGLSVSAEARAYLAQNLGADRALSVSELDKLALYMGGPGRVGVDEARAVVGDAAAVSLEHLAISVAAGDRPGLERALARAFAEGAAAVAVVRAVARHFQRLHLALGLVAAGSSPRQAMKALRPPVFFKLEDAFRLQLGRWDAGRLGRTLELLTEAELDCKTSGLPARVLSGRALMRIAQAARRK